MKILFITRDNIGGVVLSTPLLLRVLQSYAQAEIDIVSRNNAKELFEGLPNLRRHVNLPHLSQWGERLAILYNLRKEKYDLIIDLNGRRLARFLRGRKHFLPTDFAGDSHLGARFASLWPSAKPLRTKLWLGERVTDLAASRLGHVDAPLIGIGVTARKFYERWPAQNYAQLVKCILRTPAWQNAKIVLFGAAHEKAQSVDLAATIPPQNLINLVGLTTMGEVAAHIGQCDMFISPCTGLEHLAAAQGVPTIALCAAEDENIISPIGAEIKVVTPPLRPKKQVNLPAGKCLRLMTDISCAEVLSNMEGLWEDADSK